jgi:glycosyltransferase involved in cell wall biosynthesis
MKVALVCDWLTGIGGAERVLLELHKMYPDAPIYTSQYDSSAVTWLQKADVRTTSLQHLPKTLKKFLPRLRAWSFSRLDLSEYDLVISSSGAEAKAVKTDLDTIHVCYMHAPTHYYWARYDEYIKHPGFGRFDFLARFALKILARPMRRWDHNAAQRPNYLIANSSFTQVQIKKYYGRESVVIHPPVDTERFKPGLESLKRNGFLIAGRQTPYKRFDLAISACTRLNVPLTVIGNGPDHNKLVEIAGPSVTFLSDISDNDMPTYFQSAKAFLFPGTDDFGIVAVEALAAGTPVIAYKSGGALDYIHESKNGLFFDKPTTLSIESAIQRFNELSLSPKLVEQTADIFSEQQFTESIQSFIKNLEN